jgi:AcrR family transcriptional regulator
MEVKERKLRTKEESRARILDAALRIAKEHGWQAVSMRKIADMINLTPPVIYDHFLNKEAILMELGKIGFARLAAGIWNALQEQDTPAKQLESMWMAYWDFAFAEKELYQLMFDIGTQGCCHNNSMPEVEAPAEPILKVIRRIRPEQQVLSTYFSLWSAVHGLISLNMVYKGNTAEFNQQVLMNAIRNVTASPSD